MKKHRGPSLAPKTSWNLPTKVSLIYPEIAEPKERLKEFWDMKLSRVWETRRESQGDQDVHGTEKEEE